MAVGSRGWNVFSGAVDGRAGLSFLGGRFEESIYRDAVVGLPWNGVDIIRFDREYLVARVSSGTSGLAWLKATRRAGGAKP
jgi:hypothetical protein